MRNNSWSPQAKDMYCTEGVALIVGSYLEGQSKSVAFYGPGGFMGFKRDNPWKLGINSLDYVGGGVITCGGNYGMEKTCLHGTYNKHTLGLFFHY